MNDPNGRLDMAHARDFDAWAEESAAIEVEAERLKDEGHIGELFDFLESSKEHEVLNDVLSRLAVARWTSSRDEAQLDLLISSSGG